MQYLLFHVRRLVWFFRVFITVWIEWRDKSKHRFSQDSLVWHNVVRFWPSHWYSANFLLLVLRYVLPFGISWHDLWCGLDEEDLVVVTNYKGLINIGLALRNNDVIPNLVKLVCKLVQNKEEFHVCLRKSVTRLTLRRSVYERKICLLSS